MKGIKIFLLVAGYIFMFIAGFIADGVEETTFAFSVAAAHFALAANFK